jgi:hypothetical protein
VAKVGFTVNDTETMKWSSQWESPKSKKDVASLEFNREHADCFST